ncbi:hypothetical protein BGZ95_006869 [Linnemannia exigua]|uniref:Crinkler effector protein N-terminal domain-containing protein n=1 Tax=Linnemannia exigua TaxID=604196 RepID=A0AAD4H0W5_9FUNG|nr:hypothetical protein BGZ95_006869 [Linnemannia exigua]
MTDRRIGLFCLVDGEALSHAFPVEMETSKTIGDLKDLIKAKKAPRFDDIAAAELTLWRVAVPDDDKDDETCIFLDNLLVKNKLRAASKLSMVFDADFPEDTIRVMIQHPPPGSSPKRHHPHTLINIIGLAGLTEKAVVDGEYDLALLDNKERVTLLGFIGQKVGRLDAFRSLPNTALALQGTKRKSMDKLSALDGTKWRGMDKLCTPGGIQLPVVNAKNLYIRKTYVDLYDTIYCRFESKRPYAAYENEKHVVVTGTAGIGKSAFLVYFAIRLLAESDDDDPPIIVFHTKGSRKCYVFGGRSTVRSGDVEAFEPFLSLPDTWYFVDSSHDPVLGQAKTVIAYSTKILYSEARQFKDVDKEVTWRHHMAPWDLEELKKCRTNVVDFEALPLEAVEDLYSNLGGVPRYVLRWAMEAFNLKDLEGAKDPEGTKNLEDAKACARLERAKTAACFRLEGAISMVKDPLTLMQFFAQGKDSLEFSSRLIHR